jgi:phage/plasmid-associated DNA primase
MTWTDYISRVMPDPAQRDRFQRALGYTFTDSKRGECLFWVIGPARSGKTTFVRLMAAALPDLTGEVSPTVFGNSAKDPANTLLFPVIGKRFVSCNVGERGIKLNPARIKSLVSDEQLPVRRKGGQSEPVTLGKFWLFSNGKPYVQDDRALVLAERIRFFYFTHDQTMNRSELIEWWTTEEVKDELAAWIRDGMELWFMKGFD